MDQQSKLKLYLSYQRNFAVGFLMLLFGFTMVTADTAAGENLLNTEQQKQLYREAVAGDAHAQFELGSLFEYGRGVEQDDSIAADWYEKSALQQFSSAQYRLAVLLDNGWGRESNKEAAFALYKAAAESGDELARHDVAIMYFQGVGTKKNLVQAYKWLKIATLNGSPLMQKHLGVVAGEMSAEEIELASALAEGWETETGL